MVSVVKAEGYPMKNLVKTFEDRKTLDANRASAVFPFSLKKDCDLHIVFLNYWTLKNEIPESAILVNIRIYDLNGGLLKKFSSDKLSEHNQFSIAKILGRGNGVADEGLDGAVFVEILSIENIKFVFPAIIGIYQSGNLFSAVHSAGRVKNNDETQVLSYTEETNWTCKFQEGVSPFFHYFNGPSKPVIDQVMISLRSANGDVKERKEVSVGDLAPFGSKIFLVKDIFKGFKFSNGDFVSVRVEHNSIFPRLVVGNFYFEKNFFEVTHSFPVIEKEDYCPVFAGMEYQAMLCGYTTQDLALTLKVFPTNCRGEFASSYFSKRYDDDSLLPIKKIMHPLGTKSKTEFEYSLDSEEEAFCIRMSGEEVPARLNASYIFSVKGVDSIYSTDIASGTVSSVYPPKYRHWGHGYCADGFATVVLVRNNSHYPDKTTKNSGRLTIYGDAFHFEYDFTVNAESCLSINITEILGENLINSSLSKGCNFFSWMLEMVEPNCDTFWICYRASDGAIFGEHGF